MNRRIRYSIGRDSRSRGSLEFFSCVPSDTTRAHRQNRLWIYLFTRAFGSSSLDRAVVYRSGITAQKNKETDKQVHVSLCVTKIQ